MLSQKEILDIENKIGYEFKNKLLLEIAFTHSSVANLINKESNERLEFLGDSILNFLTTEYLYNRFHKQEGFLSKAKAYLVSSKYLSKYIKSLNVINYLHCKTFNPAVSENVMCDLFEAILGAIYLDCNNIDLIRDFIITKLNFDKQDLEHIFDEMQDYKTKLQELIQQNPKDKLEYRVLGKSGPAHQPEFVVGVFVNDQEISVAKANGKKEAENLSAKLAYEILKNKI